MVNVLGSSIVTTFDIAPGVRLAAAWSGGETVSIYSVDDTGSGRVVETWDVWDRRLDAPRIPKTLHALELLVRRRFEDDRDVEDFIDRHVLQDDDDAFELVPASVN
jgi:hypothetical protein